ncbi:uracil-DNA glycosylase family protein [Aquimarina brevivitae]|uniref:Uracil-DNA glycosylase n=1 Tax=Aquimarina brevivitae TaxID=323412 RepID=A0A4Q7P4Y9_9FLAO|nr:uracil-DNA glycosylase family protein [Aquimarina brevivitae]RZS93772.1 uracil-DNA glycosylase [Aquimarina brevivitae]
MDHLKSNISKCTKCAEFLALGSNPIFKFSDTSSILLISQAPGRQAHYQNKAWDDPSGIRLKEWLGIPNHDFYTTKQFAILPMAFCYPGKSKTGDLPPSPLCAPLWHQKILKNIPDNHIKILIGKYAQDYYLNDSHTLTKRVQNFKEYLPNYFPIPHPSPLNNIWLKKNPWFTTEVVPSLQKLIQSKLR